MSQLFASGGQNIGVSASTSVLPMNSQSWFPLGLTGLITLLSNSLSGVFPSPAIRSHQFFTTQLVNIGFNLKSPVALATNKRISLSFEALKPSIDFSSLPMKALDGIFSPYKPVFIYTENLSFDVATFISYLCWIFLITYCSFYNNTYCFTVYIYVTKMASQSSSTNFCYNSFKLSAASSPLSAFIKVKKVRALLWIRLWLREM